MIFETHAHYDDEAFDGDRDSLIWAMHEHGIDTIINVGASLRGVRETVTLMERYPFVYGAIGVHPDEVGDLDEEKIAWMRKLCEKEKTVAVGEIGLDYYWDKESHEIQKKWFVRQMECSKRYHGFDEGREGGLFKRSDSLLFLFFGACKRIHEYGILSWNRRCCHI